MNKRRRRGAKRRRAERKQVLWSHRRAKLGFGAKPWPVVYLEGYFISTEPMQRLVVGPFEFVPPEGLK